VAAAREGQVAPPTRAASALGGGPETELAVATTPTVADLAVFHGGRGRLLRVAEVAEQLGVCNATVYRLCESGELPHIRVVNSIRVRPKDLADYISGTQARGVKSRYRANIQQAKASR
jgi:excisionase family DNA binding protein